MALKRIVCATAAALVVSVAGFVSWIAHKSAPYFAAIPPGQFKAWHPAPYLQSGQGSKWKFSHYLEEAGALNAGVDHLVLQRDGNAYDLINSRDTWGFGNAHSWDIDLIGNQLYVFDAHQHVSPGWFHLSIGQHGWLIDRLGFGPEGSFQRISPEPKVAIPSNAHRGALYRFEHGHLLYIATFRDSDDMLENVEDGDYYLTSPGVGVREIIDLEQAPTGD